MPRPYCSRHRVAETSGAAARAVRGVVMSGWRPSSTPTQPDPRLGHPTGSCCRDDRLIRASDDLSDPLGSHLCPVERGGVSWIRFLVRCSRPRPAIRVILAQRTIANFGQNADDIGDRSCRTAQIAAEWTGGGQPVVFLHAAVADRRMWHHQLAALASGYHVIAFDRRGFGETPAVDEAYSQTADSFAVLDHLVEGGRPVVLVGRSQGGHIAIDAALASPDRVAGLVLIAPSVSGAPSATPHEAVRRLLDAIDRAEKSDDLDQVNRLEAALWLDGPLADQGRVKEPARELFLAMNGIALAARRSVAFISPPRPGPARPDCRSRAHPLR